MSDFNARDYANGYRDGRIEAADEITALRAEVERLKAEAKANLDLAERHMNEKHKLRAALKRIAADDESDADLDEWGAAAVARAALEENEG